MNLIFCLLCLHQMLAFDFSLLNPNDVIGSSIIIAGEGLSMLILL